MTSTHKHNLFNDRTTRSVTLPCQVVVAVQLGYTYRYLLYNSSGLCRYLGLYRAAVGVELHLLSELKRSARGVRTIWIL